MRDLYIISSKKEKLETLEELFQTLSSNNSYTLPKFIGITYRPRVGALTKIRPYHLRVIIRIHEYLPVPLVFLFQCVLNQIYTAFTIFS